MSKFNLSHGSFLFSSFGPFFPPSFGFRVWGLGIALGFRVWGLSFRFNPAWHLSCSRHSTPHKTADHHTRPGTIVESLPQGSIWGLSNILSPKNNPLAALSQAFARSIFLRCATNLIQILFTCPVFDRFVECLEVLLGSYMVRGPR